MRPKKGLSAKAWELYHACFSEGDDIIVIDENDELYWGCLETHKDFCILTRPNKAPDKIDWLDVAFMSHDGFPVRRLRESTAAIEALEKSDTSDVPRAIRIALTGGLCEMCGVVVEADDLSFGKYRGKVTGDFVGKLGVCTECRKKVTIVRGDPWLIEAEWARLWNPNCCAPGHWLEDDEEIIVAQSSDGAYAHIWDVDTVYQFEVG